MNKIIDLYSKLNKKQKQILFISTFVFVVLSAFVLSFSFQSKEVVVDEVVASVNKKELRLASKELQAAHIPFTIEDGKRGMFNIVTNKDVSNNARISLSTIDITTNAIRGYKIFDKSSLGKSSFENKVNLIRAMSGEIETSLESIQNIQSAKVNISQPKESLFIDRLKEVKVSVILVTKDDKKLSRKQIQGIKRFISNSIPELNIKNVELIDQTGFSLDADDDDMTLSKGNEQLKYKKRLEVDLENKLIDVIAPVVGGRNNINIKLNLDIDYKRENTKKELFDPNNVIRSEKVSELSEKMQNTNKDIKGVPGAISNIQKKPNIPSKVKGKVSNREKNDNITNYEISSTHVDTQNKNYGTIKNIGVSVSFNTAPFQVKQLSNIQKKIERLVKGTINFNAKRGDKVAVEGFEYFVYKPKTKEKTVVKDAYQAVQGYLNKYSFIIKLVFLSILLYLFYKNIISKMNEIKINSEEDVEIEKNKNSTFKRNKEKEIEEQRIADAELKIQKEKEAKDLARLKLEDKIKKEMSNINSLSIEDETKYNIIIDRLKEKFSDNEDIISKLLENLVENEDNDKK